MIKVLFDVEIKDKFYIFFIDDKTSILHAYGYKKNHNGYFVTEDGEIKYLDKIIRELNKRYIKLKDVFYNGERFARYLNKYSKKSFFAKFEGEEQVALSYNDAKSLYNFYNFPKPVYGKKSRKKKEKKDIRKEKEETLTKESYEQGSFKNGQDFMKYGYVPEVNEEDNVAKRLLLGISEAVAEVSLTPYGWIYLSRANLPELEPYGEKTQDDLETADTEPKDREALRIKYETVQKQLESAGLETWEIVAELAELSQWEHDFEDISFYLSPTGKIAYSYRPKKFEEETLDEEVSIGSVIPDNVQTIMNAISRNPYLTEDEKSAIIELNLSKWIENSSNLQTEKLRWRYKNLVIEYDYKPDGNKENQDNTPYKESDGVYMQRCYDEEHKLHDKIIVYNGSSLEESLANSREVLEHELNHVNGEFGPGISVLLNEGYNTLLTCPNSSRYENEKYMAALLAETFGADTLSRGFYRMDLDTELANKVVNMTGRDRISVESEIAGLLEDIESVLFEMGEIGDDYNRNPELMERLEKVFTRLEVYHKMFTEKEMEDNAIAEILKMKLRRKDANKLINENEDLFIDGYYLST